VWDKFRPQIPLLRRGFCFHEFERRDVLFMGINPAWDGDDRTFEYVLKPTADGALNYFRHMYEYAEAMGIGRQDWTYQDLFYYRETNQKAKPETPEWMLFVVNHLVVSQKVIETIAPKLIVVCNAEASHFFGVEANRTRSEGVWMGYNFDFDENFGCHKITGCNPALTENYRIDTQLVGTYVFFSSFSQYRSRFDKKRTCWHLKKLWQDAIVSK
jgi:hypothetical protein